MNKTNQTLIIAVILTAAVAFSGGMFYGKSFKAQASIGQQGNGNFQRGSDIGNGIRQGVGGNAGGQIKQRGGFTNGEIIKKDDKSITLKLSDGGSKIIFLSSSTTVSKMTTGENNDLQVGANVMINGSSNTDGSIAAEMIQIKPNATPMNGGVK